jgi:hypothetical protein
MEIESGSAISFLDIPVIRKETSLANKSSENPPNHPPHLKRALIQSLHERTSNICNDAKICVMELVASDVILSLMVIPKVSSTRLLTLSSNV